MPMTKKMSPTTKISVIELTIKPAITQHATSHDEPGRTQQHDGKQRKN
jgi:hypothetical protein